MPTVTHFIVRKSAHTSISPTRLGDDEPTPPRRLDPLSTPTHALIADNSPDSAPVAPIGNVAPVDVAMTALPPATVARHTLVSHT